MRLTPAASLPQDDPDAEVGSGVATAGLLVSAPAGKAGDAAQGKEERSVAVDRWEKLVSKVVSLVQKRDARASRRGGNVSFRSADFK